MGDYTVRFCRNPQKLLPRRLAIDTVSLKEAKEEDIVNFCKTLSKRHPFLEQIEYYIYSDLDHLPSELQKSDLPSYCILKCDLKSILSWLIELNLLSEVSLASKGAYFHQENATAIHKGNLYLNAMKRTFEELGLTEGKSSRTKDGRYVSMVGYDQLSSKTKQVEKLLQKLSHKSLPTEYYCSFPSCTSMTEVDHFIKLAGNPTSISNLWTHLQATNLDCCFPDLDLDNIITRSEDTDCLTQLHDFLGLQPCGINKEHCPWFDEYKEYKFCLSGKCDGFIPGMSVSKIIADLSTRFSEDRMVNNVVVMHFFDRKDSPVFSSDVKMTLSDTSLYSVLICQGWLISFDVGR